MTEKEKLVGLINEADSNYNFELSVGKIPKPRVEYEAEFLLKNGVIVPPCEVGDKMYCDGKYFASHCTGEIMEFPVNVVETTVSATFRGEIDVRFDFDDFGKIVFLTKEEAEKVLAEKRTDND